jgi:hypothetical protein
MKIVRIIDAGNLFSSNDFFMFLGYLGGSFGGQNGVNNRVEIFLENGVWKTGEF